MSFLLSAKSIIFSFIYIIPRIVKICPKNYENSLDTLNHAQTFLSEGRNSNLPLSQQTEKELSAGNQLIRRGMEPNLCILDISKYSKNGRQQT
jgi:hypothetical protein